MQKIQTNLALMVVALMVDYLCQTKVSLFFTPQSSFMGTIAGQTSTSSFSSVTNTVDQALEMRPTILSYQRENCIILSPRLPSGPLSGAFFQILLSFFHWNALNLPFHQQNTNQFKATQSKNLSQVPLLTGTGLNPSPPAVQNRNTVGAMWGVQCHPNFHYSSLHPNLVLHKN